MARRIRVSGSTHVEGSVMRVIRLTEELANDILGENDSPCPHGVDKNECLDCWSAFVEYLEGKYEVENLEDM